MCALYWHRIIIGALCEESLGERHPDNEEVSHLIKRFHVSLETKKVCHSKENFRDHASLHHIFFLFISELFFYS